MSCVWQVGTITYICKLMFKNYDFKRLADEACNCRVSIRYWYCKVLKPDLVVAQNTAQSTISKIAESSYVKIVPDSDILDKSLFLLCVELCVATQSTCALRWKTQKSTSRRRSRFLGRSEKC